MPAYYDGLKTLYLMYSMPIGSKTQSSGTKITLLCGTWPNSEMLPLVENTWLSL